jgi:hypothetical protein
MNPGRVAHGMSLLLALGTAACSRAPPQLGQPAKPEGSAPSAPPAPKIPVAHFRSSAAIWFQPQPPGMNGPFGHVGSADFLALFRPNAPWPQVLARTQAVGFNADWLYSATIRNFNRSSHSSTHTRSGSTCPRTGRAAWR